MSKGYRSQPYESPIGQIWDNLTTGTTMMVREYNTQIHTRITELMGEKIIFILREKDNKCKKKKGGGITISGRSQWKTGGQKLAGFTDTMSKYLSSKH